MTRLFSFLRPCPLRVVTAEEIRAVAGASREDAVQAIGHDGRRATGAFAESYEADARMMLDVLEANPGLMPWRASTGYDQGYVDAVERNRAAGLLAKRGDPDTASNSRRWR